jgi:hypothetical protein
MSALVSFPTVAAIWISTDVDDFGAVPREATRVLRSGGSRVAELGGRPIPNTLALIARKPDR